MNSKMKPNIVVCLPTYNEAGNIRDAIAAVSKILPRACTLIIDDNSPDGTGDIADELAGKNAQVFVLHRSEKNGLGKAYLAGFDFALRQLDADLIVQMDADLSHPPEALPRLLHAAGQADLVIGSRYIPGGCTENWGSLRKAISRFGSVYARGILGLPVKDPTGGFKLWRADLLKRVLKNPISSGGYVFQVETTFYASKMGAHIVEEPIRFVERGRGSSKMTAAIAFEAFWRIPLLRLRTNRRCGSEQ